MGRALRLRGYAGLATSLVLTLALSGLAAAQESPRRKVAVLEYRAGTRVLEGIGDRLAAILQKRTSLVISTPEDARRRLPTVDAELARCAGGAPCVAALGRRLGVDEVLLIGVSELGDVILGMQRVRSQGGAVEARVAESLGAGDVPDDGQLAGYLKRLLPPEDFKRFGVIRVRADVRGARVFVGGEARGETPMGDLRVAASATYAVRVSKKGYVDFNARVMVPPDGTVEVVPKLTLVGRGGAAPWYGKWWVWAGVGGAVVATTAIILVSSEDEPTEKPSTIKGWLP